ncbi:MAG: hypothetical protein ACJAZ2_002271 [Glaciecola sp.]
MEKSILVILSLILMVSCGEEVKIAPPSTDSNNEPAQEFVYSARQLNELKTASKVVYNLPSPSEMAEILYETNTIYDVEILSNPKAEGKYNTDVTRALNLGVYFADLSFTSMFDYPQQAMLFMSAAQGLSEELDIEGVFKEELFTRLEENSSSKDSIMEIVSYTYLETDFYLQENDRSVIAKAILAGAWIEGLYIATHLKTEDSGTEEIWKKIGDQKRGLTNLINMVEDCNEPQLQEFILKLRKLEKAFESVEILTYKEVPDTTLIKLVKTKIIVSDMTAANIDVEVSACRDYMVIGK